MDPHQNLGIILEKSGDLSEALNEYREAVRLAPNNPAPHFNLGCALVDLGRHDEAVIQFKQALRLKPDFKLAEFRLQELGASQSHK